jgi:hypothetical protein
MDKFNFYGHDMVVMTDNEFREILADTNAKGYMIGHSDGHLKGYELGKRM